MGGRSVILIVMVGLGRSGSGEEDILEKATILLVLRAGWSKDLAARTVVDGHCFVSAAHCRCRSVCLWGVN
jgi:hypothetical protein